MTDTDHIRPRVPIFIGDLLVSAISKIIAEDLDHVLTKHEIQALEFLHEKLYMLIMNANARETYEAIKANQPTQETS